MNAVTVILSEVNDPEWSDLRCLKCGRKLCNVNALVETVLIDNHDGKDIIKELDKPMIEIKCRGCNSIYNILIQ